jgi:exonuclease SbcD
MKFREIFDLAKRYDVKGIILSGDTLDAPEVANQVLLEVADLFMDSPVLMWDTIGNHTIYGYNLETFKRSSLRVLSRLCPKYHVQPDPTVAIPFDDKDGTTVLLSFTPYSNKMDVGGYGYSPEYSSVYAGFENAYRIHVSHGMLLDHEPPFDGYTLLKDVQTTANLVLTGHDHIGFGIHQRADGVTFCNPGSITRLAASVVEMERPIRVALITVDKGKANIELIRLESARPGSEVLDRTAIEAAKERVKSMENFTQLLKSIERPYNRSPLEVLAEVAKVKNIAQEIVDEAAQLISQAQEKLAKENGKK